MPEHLALHVDPRDLSPTVRRALERCPYTCMVTGAQPLPIDAPTRFSGILVLEGRAGAELAPELVGELQGYLARGGPFLIAAPSQDILVAAMGVVAALTAPVEGHA